LNQEKSLVQAGTTTLLLYYIVINCFFVEINAKKF